MNRHANPTNISTAVPPASSSARGAVLRVLLPVFLVVYAALPIAVARHAR
jgi:hypothetical protein